MVNVTKINVQEFLDACFGYLETLIVQEYHHLRYMGYNSLYECNMNFYILYGPLMFVNASESSSFALQAPSTDGDRRHMVSMKLLARDFNSNTLFSNGNIFFIDKYRTMHAIKYGMTNLSVDNNCFFCIRFSSKSRLTAFFKYGFQI